MCAQLRRILLKYYILKRNIGERCTGWLIFFIFSLKVLLLDVLSRTWSYKIEQKISYKIDSLFPKNN